MARIRFSLRLFILGCILASVLVAWFGVSRKRALDEARHQASHEDRWVSFSPYGGHSTDEIGGYYTDGNGVITFAIIKDVAGFERLHSRPDACARLKYLFIAGDEAYDAFEPDLFPELEDLALARMAISQQSLSKLESLPKLRELDINDQAHDPIAPLISLAKISSLRRIQIHSEQIATLETFPILPQIISLVIDDPTATPHEVRTLKSRLPNCDVWVNVGPYDNPLWLQ